MGKRSKRADRPARDIHTTIREAAERLSSAPAFGMSAADEVPEIAELMDAACGAVHASVPATFDFHGRRYWLRVRLAIQCDIFDSSASAAPLLRGASISVENFGHAPGH